MRKPTICIGENEAAVQISFAVTANLISAFVFATWIKLFLFYLYPKYHAVTVQPDLCRTWSKTQIVGFLVHKLISLSMFEVL